MAMVKLMLISLVISASCVGTTAESSLTCEGLHGELDCGSNVIHIHKANYGRTDTTTCSFGRPANQLRNINCYAPTTLPIIRDRCEGRTKCAVHASHHIFSDPCGGISKYLDISYSCVPLKFDQTCEGHHTRLECGSNAIRIHTANYGRRDKTTCSSRKPWNQLRNTDCSASAALPIVRQSCEGRTTCLLQALNSIFSDPCSNTYKYLNIFYSCVPLKSVQACDGHHTRLECASNVIRIHTASYGRRDRTTCSSGRPSNQLSNIDCSAPAALPIVKERCEGKTTCLLQASLSYFPPDPCGGIYKYLDISYSCGPKV